MNKIIEQLPKMLTGEELDRALEILPDYDESIRDKSQAERLIRLSDVYQIYVPNQMSREIYSKTYLALLRSLNKKQTKMATMQLYENRKRIMGKEFSSIMGATDAFSVLGSSGIGKTSTITRVVNLITQNLIIETENPYCKIIPCLVVQTPWDSSVKATLIEILRLVDERLGTKYYTSAAKSRATTDSLIGMVSSVCLNHIGLLVIDEIQNVINHKNGKNLIGSLVQLINSSGISVCMVGTPECVPFFTQAQQLARRSLGLQYGNMEYGNEFRQFCETLFRYQYVQHKTTINDGIIQWLYEHSQGNPSMVVGLLHDAQEIAILDGREALNMETLNDAYRTRMTLLHDYIEPVKRRQGRKPKVKQFVLEEVEPEDDISEEISIVDMVARAKQENRDIVDCLCKYIIVEGVKV